MNRATSTDERVNSFLTNALERIAALPTGGPAPDAARAALREATTLRRFLNAEAERAALIEDDNHG